MWQRLLTGLFLAALAYAVVRYFSSSENFSVFPRSYPMTEPHAETPAFAPRIREPIPRGDMNVSAGGPNSPNVAAPVNMPSTIAPEPNAADPYQVTTESAHAPENLRHPERSFGPGVLAEQVNTNVEAGLANSPVDSSQAFQTFSPEFVQNGGSFFGTVSAVEDENPNYSAF